ncbi:MAG: M1 family aminopeptidase [Limnohabitans sp.]|nr:M1 family aminopeptidase [Limnohabitans sp.]
MKKTLLLLLTISSMCFSQTEEYKTEQISEMEAKSASKKMMLRVNPNTLNYDLTYGKLEFTVDPAVNNIAGKVALTFKALSDMNTVVFDFYKNATPFNISSVKINGTTTTFSHNATHELVINLPATLTTGNTAIAEVTYNGAPGASGMGSFTIGTHGSSATPVMWTLSEPYGARDWWPCKQDLNDKIDAIEVYITAPSTYTSVSNGVKQSETINGANKTTYFKHNYPIPAYLIAIAVTDYVVKNSGTAGGNNTPPTPTFPIIDYIYPENNTPGNATNLARTVPILNFYETKIGAYGFNTEKYGHAQFGWGGGMEHTTVSFMYNFNRDLISHEMAHQWFGDKITCGSWKDIWLNEGITEYMSGCVVENFDGATSFITWKTNKINSITSTTTGNLYLYDSQINDINRIFSSQMTYNKGSMVTNMLRFIMGDTNFFQALRNYLNDPLLAYKYAVTPQFQTHLEAVHGSSLQEFFNDWVYNEGYPSYNITAYNSGVNQASVQINQTQSITNPAQTGYVSYFEMPVPIRLILNDGSFLNTKLNNTFNGQTFTVALPAGKTVTNVIFDPGKDIISKNNTAVLSNSSFTIETMINVYPNPVNDYIMIDIASSLNLEKVTIFNILGQKVLESTQNKINVSNLSKGVYEVNIETSQGKLTKKIVKE